MNVQEVRAAFVKKDGGVELLEIPKPRLEEDSILVGMKASGICGTDLEKIVGKGITSTILGHEVSGVVTESSVDGLKRGDRVVPHHHVSCNSCALCMAGAHTMCQNFKNSNFVPGGFADEFLVPEYNVSHGGVHKISSSLSFEEASFAEPLGCCIRGLNHTGIKSSEMKFRKVLVVGAGPIGLLHMELIRHMLPGVKLAAVDVMAKRLQFSSKYEDAVPIDASKREGSFSQAAMAESDSTGFDLVIVATGNSGAFSEALRSVRKSGTVLLFGAPHKGSVHSLDLSTFFLGETTITSSYSTTEVELQEAIDLLESRKIDVKKFVSATYPLAKVEEAMSVARSEDLVKVLVTE